MEFYKRNKEVFPSVCKESFYSVFHRPMPVNCLAVRRRQTENWSLDRVQTGAFDWRSQELGMFLRMKCFLSTLQTNEITLCGIFSRHSADTHPRVLVGRISSQESLCLLHAFCSPSSDDLGLIWDFYEDWRALWKAKVDKSLQTLRPILAYKALVCGLKSR